MSGLSGLLDARSMIGPDELRALRFGNKTFAVEAPAIPLTEEMLQTHARSHILIFTPKTFADGSPITINSMRDLFGTDPSSEPCFYNQDWYLKEDFANAPLDGKWHLIRKNVLEDARAKPPEAIEDLLGAHEKLPSAGMAAFAFFAWWFHTGGEKLWKHDFLWCSDRDHNGDRIYVGRYEDPDGVNKNGFNIHRHLSLRPSYSAAPEIVS